MDKLRQILNVLKKQQFWVISGIVVLVAIICWWLATAGLAGQFAARKSKIEGDFKNAVVGPSHPNQSVIDKINQQRDLLKRSVFSAWEILYKEQKQKNPLPNVLSDDFKQAFEKLKPNDELAPRYVEMYQNYIKQYIPALRDIVDVRHPADQPAGAEGRVGDVGPARGALMEGGPMERRGNTDAVDWVGIVDWNENDYLALASHFNWTSRPSTAEILMAQEDLWVYEALLRVIKKTNEGATNYTTAAVKRIEALQIGPEAAKAWKDAEAPIFRGGGAGGGGGGVDMMMGGPSGGGEFGMAEGRPGVGAQDAASLSGRYVDDKVQPLAADAKQPYEEFKMMPIRLELLMNERQLPKLLVACANSNMPIEVRRVRIKKLAVESTDMGQMAGGEGGGPGMMMSRTTAAGPLFGRDRSMGQSPNNQEEAGPFDAPVEIQGVIYIYNPPDRQKLVAETAAADKPADGGATQPAAGQPPATQPRP